MSEKEVLIVGAGPTGLVLAMELAYYNVPFKLIDQKSGPGESSRAMLVVPKVLESYQKYGLDQKILSLGIQPDAVHYYLNNGRQATIQLKRIGSGQCIYPNVVTFPQDEHEQLLVEQLKNMGHDVFWSTRYETAEETGDGVEVTLNHSGQSSKGIYRYVIGCDGASSQVRKDRHIKFTGETYEEAFYVLDATVEGDLLHDRSISFSFKGDHFALFFPLRDKETTRVIGMYPPDLTEKKDFSFESLRPYIEEAHCVSITKKNWFSDYRVHRRTADHFKDRAFFLAGDAAHVHSPAGGQGMNLGIGDAVNLGWKLAEVNAHQTSEKLLDTYEAERKALAESTVSLTDRAFKTIASQTLISQLTRTAGIPLVTRMGSRSGLLQKNLFKVLSQLYISYEESPLNGSGQTKLKSGERLPYADGETLEFTREAGWQLHYFNDLFEYEMTQVTSRISPVKRRWTDKARNVGFEKDHFYLVRPDGYISWSGDGGESSRLITYLNDWDIK